MMLQLIVRLPVSEYEEERSISNQTNLKKNKKQETSVSKKTAFGTLFEAHRVGAAERVLFFAGLDNLVWKRKVKKKNLLL